LENFPFCPADAPTLENFSFCPADAAIVANIPLADIGGFLPKEHGR
jgi:hypothetical protein